VQTSIHGELGADTPNLFAPSPKNLTDIILAAVIL